MTIRKANSAFKSFFDILNDILPSQKTSVKAFCRSGRLFYFVNDMIKCHLSKLMGEHKLKIADVARETGLHRNTITLLYDETAVRVDIEAIDKLCALFDVQVGQLFERVMEKSAGVTAATE